MKSITHTFTRFFIFLGCLSALISCSGKQSLDQSELSKINGFDINFYAEHGSWNRSTKVGYRVSLVELDSEGNSTGYTSFADGWEKDGEVFGRPVDILELGDGSLLVSDDYGNKIYRISYGK